MGLSYHIVNGILFYYFRRKLDCKKVKKLMDRVKWSVNNFFLHNEQGIQRKTKNNS